MSDDLITINIDGTDYAVPAGTNLIDAAAMHGLEIPHYCYHPHLSVVGNCRMCLIEMGTPMRDRGTGEPVLDENGQQKIGWVPKPVIACSTTVSPGMHVKLQSDLVKECREGVMEFLLVNHPLDCPICDQAGECRLQEFATDYGRGYSRFVENKNVKPKRTRLGPRITLDDERCILCSRCIRFCDEVIEEPTLGFVDRGSYSTLTCYPGKEFSSNYSLNTVDICPVGALTSTDFRFQMRVWFLKPVNSICTESSVGANTEVWSREGKVYRITPRRNDAVNDSWMSDSGRMLYKQIEDESRILRARADSNECSIDVALDRAAELLQAGEAAYVGSPFMSLEEQFLLKKLAERKPGAVHFAAHVGEGDGFLISEDRSPNMRGAFLHRMLKDYPGKDLAALEASIDAGEVQSLVVFDEDIVRRGIAPNKLKKVHVIYVGTHQNDTSELARVILPGQTVFERSGTFVNQQFRVQKFLQAVPGIAGARSQLHLLGQLLSALGDSTRELPSLPLVWDVMAREVPELAGLSYALLPDDGQPLDGSAFDAVQWPEQGSLHWKPMQAAAANA